jgi:hypothetical protein
MKVDGRSDGQSVFNWPLCRVAEEPVKWFENINARLFCRLNIIGGGPCKRN